MTPRSDDWSSNDLDYQQPRCALCLIVMRDIPGGWWCPSCQAGIVLSPDISEEAAISYVGPRQTRLRRGA